MKIIIRTMTANPKRDTFIVIIKENNKPTRRYENVSKASVTRLMDAQATAKNIELDAWLF